ncbi:MAG: hypothetical protein IKW82_07595 [Bacteroidales bacterium]|nr:hypothetical protein [Bacteroidales bacterium]
MEEFDNTAFNKEIAERVDRFLRKEMSKEESIAFVEEVKSNPELKEYYQRQFNLMRGINFEQIREIMNAKENQAAAAHANPNGFIKLFAPIAVAASLVLGVFIWDGNRTTNVGDEMYSQVLRDGNDIDELVNDHKYQEAIDEIDKLLDINYDLVDDPEVIAAYNQSMNDLKYKKALIYLKMGKKKKAKEILHELNDERSKQVLKQLLW